MKFPYTVKILSVTFIFLAVQCWAVDGFSGQATHSYGIEEVHLGPLHGRNQAPLLNLFYIMPATDAQTLGKGGYDIRVDFEISNIYERHSAGNSMLIYDMEIYRTALHTTFGVRRDMDIHVEIPMLAFNGGRLDGSIQEYHDIFGLPNGDRETSPDNSYDYSYTVNGRTVFDFPSHGLKLSDTTVDLKWRLLDEKDRHPAVAARFGLKIPTGQYEDGSGSGEFDYSLGLVLSKSYEALHLFGGMDYTLLKEPAELEALIDENIVHFFIGAEYELIDDALSFICQLDGQNTPFVETGQRALDKDVLEIVVGVRGMKGEKKRLWQFSLREDLIHYSTVDFTLTFSLLQKFQ